MSNKIFTIQHSTNNNNDHTYADISMLSFTVKNEKTNKTYFKIQKITDVNAIRNSLHNIFTWIPGQRILLPEFGSDLRQLLYEGITTLNTSNIVASIKYAISQWEPRINVDDIYDASNVEDHNNNQIHLIIVYSIPTLTTEKFQYDYIQNIASF